MHARFVDQPEAELTKLQRAAEKGLLRDPALAHQRFCHLQERCRLAAGACEVSGTPIATPAFLLPVHSWADSLGRSNSAPECRKPPLARPNRPQARRSGR
jgi:hypothetical protein